VESVVSRCHSSVVRAKCEMCSRPVGLGRCVRRELWVGEKIEKRDEKKDRDEEGFAARGGV
jgi:hypothetical protein